MSEPNRITGALAPALDLNLFQLESGLAGLIEYREERISDTENPPDAEELAALDAEIQRYEIATPAKVSGVAAVVRNWRAKILTARVEIDRLQKIAAHYEAMETRLKDYVGSILERQPMPKKGCRKLVGADGSQLMLKGNGGLQPLEITDPAMVPDECVRLVGSIPLLVWRGLLESAGIDGVEGADFTKQLDNARIREALAQPCEACRATGRSMVGYAVECSRCRNRKPPHGRSVPMEMASSMCGPDCPGYIEDPDPGSLWPDETDTGSFGMKGPKCRTCGGSGKNAVPGARLLDRGSHVEIK